MPSVSAWQLDDTPAALEVAHSRLDARGARDRACGSLPRKGVHLWPEAAEARDALDELQKVGWVELASDRVAVSRNAQLTQLPAAVFAEVVFAHVPKELGNTTKCVP